MQLCVMRLWKWFLFDVIHKTWFLKSVWSFSWCVFLRPISSKHTLIFDSMIFLKKEKKHKIWFNHLQTLCICWRWSLRPCLWSLGLKTRVQLSSKSNHVSFFTGFQPPIHQKSMSTFTQNDRFFFFWPHTSCCTSFWSSDRAEFKSELQFNQFTRCALSCPATLTYG